jgi:hypothetical protein
VRLLFCSYGPDVHDLSRQQTGSAWERDEYIGWRRIHRMATNTSAGDEYIGWRRIHRLATNTSAGDKYIGRRQIHRTATNTSERLPATCCSTLYTVNFQAISHVQFVLISPPSSRQLADAMKSCSDRFLRVFSSVRLPSLNFLQRMFTGEGGRPITALQSFLQIWFIFPFILLSLFP